MTALTPRGPLQARVYWVRRMVVLGVAGVLVIVLATILGGGSDGKSSDTGETPTAQLAGENPTTPQTQTSTEKKGKKKRAKPKLAEPDGPCADNDIDVTPVVHNAVGGRDVTFVLKLRTIESAACTWRVGPESLTLKVTSGKDEIWFSRHCPKALPRETVVVRRAKATRLRVEWNAKRSDEDCSALTSWAMPGYYHLSAAALAGEPNQVKFELNRPTSATITRTVAPSPKPGKNKNKTKSPDSD